MIGRPQAGDAAPYFVPYIEQVPGDSVLAVIESQLDESLSLFAGISEEASLHRYEPDKWSIRQLLNHVTDTERALAFRALWFGRGFTTPMPSYDQNIAAAGAAADGVSWSAHVDEFQHVRESTVSLFRNMPEEGWKRAGIASDEHVTVLALAFLIAGHLSHHVKILREKYL
ncbi:MAG TPA: DinB family protein [Bryobacteraceae bacterium]|nr:DinB family protein [Bryobacteraceae bacterium]